MFRSRMIDAIPEMRCLNDAQRRQVRARFDVADRHRRLAVRCILIAAAIGIVVAVALAHQRGGFMWFDALVGLVVFPIAFILLWEVHLTDQRRALRNAIACALADARPARCPACGYDLRGIESDRCPECGAETAITVPSGPQPARAQLNAAVRADHDGFVVDIEGTAVATARWSDVQTVSAYQYRGPTGDHPCLVFWLDGGTRIEILRCNAGWPEFIAAVYREFPSIRRGLEGRLQPFAGYVRDVVLWRCD
jgi:hypothetical protein